MKRTLLSLLAGLLIGAAIVYFQFPRIEKKVEVQKETQTRTVTRRVVLPDGTRTTERITDTVQKEATQSKTSPRPDWMVGVNTNLGRYGIGESYQLQVHRRILGPVSISAGISTKAEATIGVAVEF